MTARWRYWVYVLAYFRESLTVNSVAWYASVGHIVSLAMDVPGPCRCRAGVYFGVIKRVVVRSKPSLLLLI